MRFIINTFFLYYYFFNEGGNVVNVCISLGVKGPSMLLFTCAAFAAGEMNKRGNLIQTQQWHIEVKAVLLCVFEYKTQPAQ